MVYKLEPIYFDKIWGGDKLRETYHYLCSKQCGEAWGISGHKKGSSIILNGLYKGKTLAELFATNKELFGHYPSTDFPILVKLIDAKTDLSIQVHPDDHYAKKHHDSYGKTECWYILETEENTNIIIGHNKYTKHAMVEAVKQGQYEDLVNKYKIQRDDLFLIKAGTIHAICEGTLLLEVQQSSDVTYRFYDYDRLQDGEKRELHVQKALDVITIPDNHLIRCGESKYFTIDILHPNSQDYHAHQYGDYYFIIEGEGLFDKEKVSKGDFIFIPSRTKYKIAGHIKVAKIEIK